MSVRADIMVNLENELNVLRPGGGYSVEVKDIFSYSENYLATLQGLAPLLMIVDYGADELLMDDGYNTTWTLDFDLVGVVNHTTWELAQRESNDLQLALRRWVNSSPSLGDNVLGIIIVEDRGRVAQPEQMMARNITHLRLFYWTESTNQDTEGGDVFGSAHITTARTKVMARLDDLVSDMAAMTPRLSYTYNRHAVAKLQLNGVSLEIEDDRQSVEGIGAAGTVREHTIVFSARVHTAYLGGATLPSRNARLLTSVSNQLLSKLNLGDGYRVIWVDSFGMKQEFDFTMGGELLIGIHKAINYTQES